jgi:ABC-type transport system, involved in lipoprotein release, permease component
MRLFFINLPFYNLIRRPIRSGLTALGVAIAVATYLSLHGLSHGVERSWSRSMSERGIHMLALRKGLVDIFTSTISMETVKRLADVQGIKSVSGELGDLVNLKAGPIWVTGWPADSFLWNTLHLIEGRLPSASDTHSVVMGHRLAKRLGLRPGNHLNLLGTELTLLGLCQQVSILNENVLVLPLPLLQKILAKEGKISVINLRLSEPGNQASLANLKNRLERLFPDLNFLETKDVTDANLFITLLKKMNWSISIISLMMGFFFILNTLFMSISERTREIGILMAIGWSRSRILRLILFEGLLMVAFGSVFGLILGTLNLRWLSSLKQLQGFFEPIISPRFLFDVFLGTIFMGVLGSLYPAWRAIHLRPVEALKQE